MLTAVLSEGDAAGQEYRRKLEKIKQYMNHHNMRAPLRHRIRAYYELCFPTSRAFDEDDILSELTGPLREAIYTPALPLALTLTPTLSLTRIT